MLFEDNIMFQTCRAWEEEWPEQIYGEHETLAFRPKLMSISGVWIISAPLMTIR